MTEKIGEFYDRMNKEKVRLRFIGRIEELPENVKAKCIEYEEKTKNNNKIQAILAFNYGGRSEIVDAVKKIIDSGISSIDEQTFRNYLYAPDIPDPDLVIRTSGEMRISNFLLWEIAYSELYFSKLLWPEFSEEELEKSIKAYQVRERRFGGIR